MRTWGATAETRPHYGLGDLTPSNRQRRKPIIGIAGGIGAGKSTVARLLEELGAAVIDSDRLSHEQYRDPEVVATLCGWWGNSILTSAGEVDREAIARIVFEKPDERVRLEELIYPRIEQRRRELMAVYESDPRVKAVVWDAAKLIEVGLDEQCDAVIFVESEYAVRARRVKETRGWTEEELSRREKSQNPLDRKKAKADHVVKNHSSIEALRSQVEKVFATVQASFPT